MTRVATRGRLIIVGGPPASGKSTLARRLEGTLGALRLEPDAWMSVLALDRGDGAARARVEELQWRLAADLLERGQTVILDWGVFTRAKRTALREGARDRRAAVELHFLDGPPDVLWQRIQDRGDDSAAWSRSEFEGILQEVERPSPGELAQFDDPRS